MRERPKRMTQEYLDKELFGGLGGPRYGTGFETSSTRNGGKSKPAGGDLYSFLPAQWGGTAGGSASIDSRRQQEIMEAPQSQERELGTYFPQTGGGYYVSVRPTYILLNFYDA